MIFKGRVADLMGIGIKRAEVLVREYKIPKVYEKRRGRRHERCSTKTAIVGNAMANEGGTGISSALLDPELVESLTACEQLLAAHIDGYPI